MRKPAVEITAVQWDGTNITEFESVDQWTAEALPHIFVDNNGVLEVRENGYLVAELEIGEWYVSYSGKATDPNPIPDMYQEIPANDGSYKYTLEAE